MARIFISYRNVEPDKTIAEEIYRALLDHGHVPFFGGEMKYGQPFGKQIDEALEQCETFLALVSRAYCESDWACQESIRACGRQKKYQLPDVVPVFLEKVNLNEISEVTYGGVTKLGDFPAIYKEGKPDSEIIDEILKVLPTSFVVNNLPPRPDLFVARQNEIEFLSSQLTQKRCATIIGPGGMGKTQLGIAVADRLCSHYLEGLCFVDLGDLQGETSDEKGLRVARKILIALMNPPFNLNINDSLNTDFSTLLERLAAGLAQKKILLLLDNCEYVPSDCKAAIESLRAACPDLSILSMSRIDLEIHNLRTLELHPLDLSSAEDMFRDLASLTHNPKTDSLVKQICERLDGMPLMIELVAAQLNSPNATLESVLEMCRSKLTTLEMNSSPHERHRKLDAVMQWSYDNLLNDEHRLLFRRVSILLGKWQQSAAEALLEETGFQKQADTLLKQLVLKRLIRRETKSFDMETKQTVAGPEGDDYYYYLLEPIRQYGEHLLQEEEKANPGIKPAHDVASHYYRSLLDKFAAEEIETSSLDKFYNFDEPELLSYRREWLYHTAFRSDRISAQLDMAKLFFDAFWWWDEYVDFPFCAEILERWKHTQSQETDRGFVEILQNFRDHYPKLRNWKETDKSDDWFEVEQALEKVQERFGCEGEKIPRKRNLRAVKAFTDNYLSDAIVNQGDIRKSGPEAIRLQNRAIEAWRMNKDYACCISYRLFSMAEIRVRMGEIPQAFRLCWQALKEREGRVADKASSFGKKDDYEVLCQSYRVAGDAYWLRMLKADNKTVPNADFEKAWIAYQLADWNAYLYQAYPHPADPYTAALHEEIGERIVERLRDSLKFGLSSTVEVARKLHEFWDPYWKIADSAVQNFDISDLNLAAWIDNPEKEDLLKGFLRPPSPIDTLKNEEERKAYAKKVLRVAKSVGRQFVRVLEDSLTEISKGSIMETSVQFHELESLNDESYDDWLDIYQRSFPLNEQMLVSSLNRILRERERAGASNSHFLVGRGPEGKALVMAQYDLEPEHHLAALWYIAVHPDHRIQGLGSMMYQELVRRIQAESDEIKALLYEVEDPSETHSADEKEIALRRIQFYRKNGGKLLGGIHYVQSVGWQPALPMHLMVNPFIPMDADSAFETAQVMFGDSVRQVGDLSLE